MKRMLFLVCAIISLLPLLSGCGKPAIVSIECDEFMEQKNVSRQIEIWPAYAVTVYLCSNPSTGFRWSESAVISDQSVIKQKHHEFMAPEDPSPGTPGQEMWQFRVLEKGTSTITMEYSRPGDDEPEWTFTLNVTAKY